VLSLQWSSDLLPLVSLPAEEQRGVECTTVYVPEEFDMTNMKRCHSDDSDSDDFYDDDRRAG
jgi:hypothetical protein